MAKKINFNHVDFVLTMAEELTFEQRLEFMVQDVIWAVIMGRSIYSAQQRSLALYDVHEEKNHLFKLATARMSVIQERLELFIKKVPEIIDQFEVVLEREDRVIRKALGIKDFEEFFIISAFLENQQKPEAERNPALKNFSEKFIFFLQQMRFFKTEIQVFTDYVRQHNLLTPHLSVALHFAENLMRSHLDGLFRDNFYAELSSMQEMEKICLKSYAKAEEDIQKAITEDLAEKKIEREKEIEALQ